MKNKYDFLLYLSEINGPFKAYSRFDYSIFILQMYWHINYYICNIILKIIYKLVTRKLVSME